MKINPTVRVLPAVIKENGTQEWRIHGVGSFSKDSYEKAISVRAQLTMLAKLRV